jgi:hypothetical protein
MEKGSSAVTSWPCIDLYTVILNLEQGNKKFSQHQIPECTVTFELIMAPILFRFRPHHIQLALYTTQHTQVT